MFNRIPQVFLIAVIWCGGTQAAELPSVEKLIQDHDTNGDGKLQANEVKQSSIARQFPRWDVDGDGYVNDSDIIKFRAKFGIRADGSKVTDSPRKPATPSAIKMLPIPAVNELQRADSTTTLSPSERKNSAYILKTVRHQAGGNRYVVLTDYHESEYLKPLHRLVKHYDGVLLEVDDLATLHLDRSKTNALLANLRSSKPKYVAIAPRLKSLRENMLLHVWELLAQIDKDPQLDAYPGFLVASTADGLARLVDQSIHYVPRSKELLKAMAISQVSSQTELRSLQKAAILRRQFADHGLQMPIAAVYTPRAVGAPKLNGDQVWNLVTTNKDRFVRSFDDELGRTLQAANLVVMHGHGSPGMSCSVDISAIPEDCRGKLLLTGSCFSASPLKSDMAPMREAPGGYAMTNKDAFVLRAIDSGAVATYGHMRLSQGFPHLYTVLESWMRGETIGQSYQQLINGLLEKSRLDSRALVMNAKALKGKRSKQGVLLYVLIGDPALQPLVKMLD
ncbi:MAG: hypothetical protein COA78_31000 [Blastopirellula sp.]|nr:MAG: hypothetical protein COA78_31000 [Blastopirellula sp.]